MKDAEEINAYGFNCTCGPMHMAHIAETTEFYGKTVSIMPNAGYPTIEAGRTAVSYTHLDVYKRQGSG